MASRLPFAMFVLALASLLTVSAAGQTQKPRAPAAADAVFDVQKGAFLTLPIETRKAVQDALVWLGLYNGAGDGEFGKRTRDSIVALQTSQKQAADGVLSPKQTEALMAKGARRGGLRDRHRPQDGRAHRRAEEAHGRRGPGHSSICLQRGRRSCGALRPAFRRRANPQGRLQDDETRRVLRCFGARRRRQILCAL